MKKILWCGIFFLLMMSSVTHAALTTIGTATYNGEAYNLIWDDNNNSNSVVWLDYSNYGDWASQVAWASRLNDAGVLRCEIDPAYTVEWGTSAWRLPTTVDGPVVWGCDSTTTQGYNITTSEMGHLFYEELGNSGCFDTSQNWQNGWGLTSTGNFENLIETWYWSGTRQTYSCTSDHVWGFDMPSGYQGGLDEDVSGYGGLALRIAQVSTVPVPGTFWLFGLGLAGIASLGRRKRETANDY